MVKTRQTSEDLMSAKINKLKRGSDICKRFDPLEEEPKPGIKMPKDKPKKHVEYELPDYTQWFDIDSINYIEEECADNIFIGYGHDKDALHEVYKKVRNKIVELYRIEPTRFLTVTDCIRRLGMDASIVMKVHSLLNYWGIINYQATNNFGEKIFNKRLNEQMVDLKGNQSNIHKRRVKLNFNQILDKDSTQANVNTYYNSLSYNDSTKRGLTKKSFDFDSIEDVVRYSSELNAGHHGVDVNYPLCSGCSNPCKTSYYILGPDSLGEVSNTVRSRGLWCSLCYGNSNYPITLSKDSFVRIDLPPRLSETISKLFEQNRSLLNEEDSENRTSGILDTQGMRSRDGFNNEVLKQSFGKSRIKTGIPGTQEQNEKMDDDGDLEELVSSSNEEEFVGSMEKDGLDVPNGFSSDIDDASNSENKENMRSRLNELSTYLENRGDGASTVYGTPLSTSNPKNTEEPSTSNHSYEGTQRSNDDYDSYGGDSYNESPKTQSVRDNNESISSSQGRDGAPNNSGDMSRFGGSNVKMPWTTEDFERLYEAIRKYGTDWQSVAQHMGEDSTPNECVFQFINAPLEKEVTSKLKLTTYMDPPTTSLLGTQFPFFDSPNTIVTLLSFCASVVSPVVASYAAKAAFNIILKASAKNSINGIKEPRQIQELSPNDNSTNARVQIGSRTPLEESLNHADTALNSVNDLYNGTLPNNYDGTTLANSVNSTSSNASNHNYEGEGTQINHVNDAAGALNGISAGDTGEVVEGSSDLDDVTSTEGEAQSKRRVSKFVDGSTLQLAAAAALGAAAARAGELAEKEQERLSEALPHLISLKIKRITEKLNRYNETQEQMKTDQMHLEKELFRILKCKGIFQNNS